MRRAANDMKRRAGTVLLFLAAVLAGSATATSTIPVIPVSSTLSAGAGVLEWRYLGYAVDTSSPCPVPTGGAWVVRSLFAGSPAALSLPPGLAGFCLYEPLGGGEPTASDISNLLALVPGNLRRLDPDLMVVGPAATVDTAVWQAMQAEFELRAGRLPPRPPTAGSTRLAVVDTAPSLDHGAEQVDGHSPHGPGLLRMAHRLLCDPVFGCGVRLTSRLALAYLTYDPTDPAGANRDDQQGGYVGTVAELAQAVREEVVEWLDAGESRLVLNLSVGWEERGVLVTQEELMPVPMRAVYRALRDASCRGVVTVAAAGNLTGGPGSGQGPLLPAAWEMYGAPGEVACQEALGLEEGAPPVPVGEVAYRPLVHAVGGVRASGESLVNSRPGAQPRLLAYGDHAVVATSLDSAPTAVLTGSSVAALVASSSVAAVWSHRPELAAHEVVETVYGAGEPSALPVTFCLGSLPGQVCSVFPGGEPANGRRVSVCAAVAAACSGPECMAPQCLTEYSEPISLSPGQFSIYDNIDVPEVDAAMITAPYGAAPPCHPESLQFDASFGPPSDPCPHRQYHGLAATPWVDPQPGTNPCPTCTLFSGSGTLLIQVASSFQGTLQAPTLNLCGNTLALPVGQLQPGSALQVNNIQTGGCTAAQLSFAVAGGSALTSPLVVP